MDIIQVIIFVVIIAVAIVQQISKASKKEKAASPKEVLADMFPDIEREEQVAAPVPVQRKPKPVRKQYQPVVPEQAAVHRMEKKPQNNPPIKLNTREEARRAFIYSEIFNRKY